MITVTQPRSPRPWVPPPVGWLKANTDSAFDCVSRSGGIGVVIRDHFGDVVGGVCSKIVNLDSCR